MRLLIHFARYGPYHHARLQSAHEVLSPLGWEVIGLETASRDATYEWEENRGTPNEPKIVTAFTDRVHEEITATELRQVLFPLLDSLAPTAMAIAGWGSTDALTCLQWCRKKGVRRIVMSETRANDGKRVWWRELVKRFLISRFDGAMVGGKSHREYLVKLGMKPENIAYGYNIVDNKHFARGARLWQGRDGLDSDQKSKLGFNPPYFLASNRFIERKNLLRLIEAYHYYCENSYASNHKTQIWSLCLLGDGEQKHALVARCHDLGLQAVLHAPWEGDRSRKDRVVSDGWHRPTVYFPGFRQVDELPRFYAHAGCFIHPALDEPWGLVINEAMACGLPILSSSNVGSAEELIDEGENGWLFHPEKVEEITETLQKISRLEARSWSSLSEKSTSILESRCPTRAFGEGLTNLLIPNPL